jgi:hypothetical protein
VTVFIRKRDGYVSAAKMEKDCGVEVRSYFKTDGWKRIEIYWEKHCGKGLKAREMVNTGPKTDHGTYVHPDLVHFVAEHCSVEYAINVAKIMNGINVVVHAELKAKGLKDTRENAEPIFDEIVEAFDDAKNCLKDFATEIAGDISSEGASNMWGALTIVKEKINVVKKMFGKEVDPDEVEDEYEEEEEEEEEKVEPEDEDEAEDEAEDVD